MLLGRPYNEKKTQRGKLLYLNLHIKCIYKFFINIMCVSFDNKAAKKVRSKADERDI